MFRKLFTAGALAILAMTPLIVSANVGPGHTQEGIASYYADKFHGRQTANGERFNQNALTAAHKTLPLGTKVRVTRINTGKSVVVRINDRGPFIKGRVIDLSKRAAGKLGIIKRGLAKVRVEVIGRPSRRES
jgi:rare lipoprotein A